MKIIILILLLLGISAKDTHGTILIETQQSLNNLCCGVNVTDNLFIKGDNNIYSFSPLSNIKNIFGYLVVWNSNQIKSLYGLRHLEHVNGDITIINNENMCFVDTINWSLITTSNIDTSGNSNSSECPSCDSECIGCWGIGPRLCQICKNFISGLTCVNNCPEGTTIDSVRKICTESIPSNISSPSYLFLNDTSITIFWNETYYIPNGIILGYKIYMNNLLVNEQQIDDYNNENGYTNSTLITNLTFYNLSYNTQYNFNLQVMNSAGWSSLGTTLKIITPLAPPKEPIQIEVTKLSSSSVIISWNDSLESGPVDNYFLQFDKSNFTTENKYIQINNLNASTNYRFRIKSSRGNFNSAFTNYLYFVTPSGFPLSPINLIVDNITGTSAEISWEMDSSLNESVEYFSYYIFDGIMLNTTNTFVTLYELDQFTNYTIKVKSVNGYGESNYTSLNFRTLITKPVIVSVPTISNITELDMIVTVFNNSKFIWRRTLRIYVKKSDTIQNIDTFQINKNKFSLSEFVNVSKDCSYAFQLTIFLLDGTSADSSISQFYSLDHKKNDNSDEFTFYGLNKFWLILSASILGTVIIALVILIIICYRRKNNRIKQDSSNIQRPRPASVINSDEHMNPMYIEVIEPSRTVSYSSLYPPSYSDNNYGTAEGTIDNGTSMETPRYETIPEIKSIPQVKLKKNPMYVSSDLTSTNL